MNRDDIIRMAREAGFTDASFCRWSAYTDDLDRFAAIVAAAEREACAQVCDERQWQGLTDEEREQVINANFGTGLWQMAKDLEAKLKEKNA